MHLMTPWSNELGSGGIQKSESEGHILAINDGKKVIFVRSASGLKEDQLRQ